MEREQRLKFSDIHESKKEAESGSGADRKLGCHSITELPRYVLMDILLKLSVNILLVCRCVCKTWRSLISEPEFFKFHSAKVESCALMRMVSGEYESRTLLFVGPPDHDSNKVLSTKLKIEYEVGFRQQPSLDENGDLRFCIVNSCQGFLCLSEPSWNNPVSVCNPILGEYVNLPAPLPDRLGMSQKFDCALGFSPQTKQYKVIRVFNQLEYGRSHDPVTKKRTVCFRKAEIHTLGTSSWRNIKEVPSFKWNQRYPTYVSGSLHWLYVEDRRPVNVTSFNLFDEKFQVTPPPPHKDFGCLIGYFISLGELRGCLCMCLPSLEKLYVWVMEDYNDHTSWMQQHCLTITTPSGCPLRGLFRPISVLSNGCLMIYHQDGSGLLYYHPNGSSYKYLKVHGGKSKYVTIAYKPSFLSLKDVVSDEGLGLMNVRSSAVRAMSGEDPSAVFLEELSADVVAADLETLEDWVAQYV